MAPLAFTDSQLDQIMRLTHPLQPHQRVAFFEKLATRLNGGQRPCRNSALHKS
jgi:hypothetical protein